MSKYHQKTTDENYSLTKVFFRGNVDNLNNKSYLCSETTKQLQAWILEKLKEKSSTR